MRRGAASLAAALFALLLLIAGQGGIAHAAPVVPPPDDVDVTQLCGLGATAPVDCDNAAGLPHVDLGAPKGIARVSFGAELWSTTAAGLEYAGTVAPVPLPAAAWLILAGIGALGIAGRRRAAALPSLRRLNAPTGPDVAVEPLGTGLRGSALSDTHRFFGARLCGRRQAHLRPWRPPLTATWPQHAFPPGTASPAVPCSGFAHTYSPLAERAPPIRARRTGPRHVPGAPTGLNDMTMSPFRRHVPAPLGNMAVPIRDHQVCWRRDAGPATRDNGVRRKSKSVLPAVSEAPSTL